VSTLTKEVLSQRILVPHQNKYIFKCMSPFSWWSKNDIQLSKQSLVKKNTRVWISSCFPWKVRRHSYTKCFVRKLLLELLIGSILAHLSESGASCWGWFWQIVECVLRLKFGWFWYIVEGILNLRRFYNLLIIFQSNKLIALLIRLEF
jgi:hypothetical protein